MKLEPSVEDVIKAAKDFFPEFEIANINNPLRLTENVSKEVKILTSNSKIPNSILVSKSSPPSNIAEGHPLVRIGKDSLLCSPEECFILRENSKTMFVIDETITSIDCGLKDTFRTMRYTN